MKLGNNKKEIRIVKCYFGAVIIGGIILSVWLFLALDLIIAFFCFGMYWFLFLISPFLGADFFEIGTDEQRDKQNKKYAYKKKRGWN